jgi:hypothetical protein
VGCSTLPVSFVLIGNPNRPNGGILERFEGLEIPILGVTFDGATPTNTDFKTFDITRQYDGWSDFPTNPLNPFATANAMAGIYYLHGDYQSVGLGNALYQGSYGDTDYYMIPSQRLPLLMPLEEAGVPSPVVTILDAPLRVLLLLAVAVGCFAFSTMTEAPALLLTSVILLAVAVMSFVATPLLVLRRSVRRRGAAGLSSSQASTAIAASPTASATTIRCRWASSTAGTRSVSWIWRCSSTPARSCRSNAS